MKKKLEKEIIQKGIVDTNRFRYAFVDLANGNAVILKISRASVGTVKALAELKAWNTVREYHNYEWRNL